MRAFGGGGARVSRAIVRWSRDHPAVATLAIFVVLAIVHTWPMASNPAVYSRSTNADYLLNAWAIHWVAKTLPTDPSNVFHAGIFYPHPYALAYSEPLILQGIFAMPVVWAGGSAILAHNLVFIGGLALSGCAFAWYVRRLTGSWSAGLVSGSLAAFSAHNLMRTPHIQALHLELVPLMFVALDQLLARKRLRDAVTLGAALAGQSLISVYLLIFAGWALAVAALARFREWTGRTRWRLMAALSLAAMVSFVIAWPVLRPYSELSRTYNLHREAADARTCSSGVSDYLYTGSRVHNWWSHRLRPAAHTSNFPGAVAVGLAIVTLATGWRTRIQVRMWTAVAAGAVLLSFAPRLPGFATVHDLLPPLGAIRCYSRAGQIATLAVSVLAGFGVAWLLPRVAREHARIWLAAALLLLVNIEALRAPFGYNLGPRIPAIYDTLATEPHAVVVELPFWSGRAVFLNARYMLHATRHGHPLLNGYSGFAPPDHNRAARMANRLPRLDSVEFLFRRGITHVVVSHPEPKDRRRLLALENSGAFHKIATIENVTLFRLRGTGPLGLRLMKK